MAIHLYALAIRLAQPLSTKSDAWIRGRNQLWAKMEQTSWQRPVWIHCSSLGEFEQGRPIIEGIKKNHPDQQILLTFFSPSGYEIRKDYPYADIVCYLPIDTPANAGRFVQTVHPCLAIFVKYDFWFNYMETLANHTIPFIYISLILRADHFLLKPYLRPFLQVLCQADHLFTQDEVSCLHLNSAGCTNTTCQGDTRIDRVIDLQREARNYPGISRMTRDRFTIVMGSVWPADIQVTLPFIQQHLDKDYCFVIAPHQVDTSAIERLGRQLASSFIRLSELKQGQDPGDSSIVIVDTIGDLAFLYRYGHLAYVGGGFGKGIHSILEPAAAGKAILFGPRYQKFQEAVQLIEQGGAIVTRDASTFSTAVLSWQNDHQRKQAESAVAKYLDSNRGATRGILQYLEQHNLIG